MSRIIAVFNQAGGVAKTTLTQNLGYQIAQLGHRVLLISPQVTHPQVRLLACLKGLLAAFVF